MQKFLGVEFCIHIYILVGSKQKAPGLKVAASIWHDLVDSSQFVEDIY